MSENSGRFPAAENSLPYEDLFVEYVQEARDDLHQQTPKGLHDLLTPEAHAGWERYLLSRLAIVSAKAIDSQFQTFKAIREVFPRQASTEERIKDDLYHEFIRDHSGDRLQKLFGTFPMLRALCVALRTNWIATTHEFLVRLDAERNQLGSEFKSPGGSGRIKFIQAGLSDPHRGGRCVVRAIFENGEGFIYKPRSIAPEVHFSALIEHVNRLDIPFELKAAKCWERVDYGWMEEVFKQSCQSMVAMRAFYWRTGALLALVYLARGVDFHRGNLIAAGEFPVLIDLETLWHPQEHANNQQRLETSVLRTGFLPPRDEREAARYKWSAIERCENLQSLSASLDKINNAKKGCRSGALIAERFSHLPALDTETYTACDFVAEIQAGFQWVGDNLLDGDANQKRFEEWITILTRCRRRRVRYSTAWYQTLIERSTLPRFLGHHESRTNAWRELTNNHPDSVEEIAALQQCDVPYFFQSTHFPVAASELLPGKLQFVKQQDVIAESLTCRTASLR